jgi:ketosteroid isomerase-like protein
LNDLIARQEIADVLARFCERVDEYDIDGMAELFTVDCVTDYGPGSGGPVTGRAAFRDLVRAGQARFKHTHHQLGQIRVQITGDGAEALSYVTASHELGDGSIETTCFQYRDKFRREAGRWQIVERVALATVFDGFKGAGWQRLPRLGPPPW